MSEASSSLPIRRDTGRAPAQLLPRTPATYAAYPTEEREPNPFNSIASTLRRRLRLVVSVFVAVSLAGISLSLLQTPKYSATALVLINPNPDQVVPANQSLTIARTDAGSLESEIEVLKSPTMAARLASELNLDQDPEWNPLLQNPNPGPVRAARLETVPQDPRYPATAPQGAEGSPTLAAMNVQVDTAASGGAGAADLPGASPQPPAVAGHVVDAVAGAIEVRRRGLSNVIEITVQSESPEKAAHMANSLSNIYMKSLTEARFDTSEKANLWLKDRLDELKAEVLQKQAAAQAYRAQRNLLTAQGVSLVEQQIAQIQSGLLQTRAEHAQRQAEYEQLLRISERGGNVATLASPSDAMRELRAKEAELAQRIADLETRYGDQHPTLRQAREEQAAIASEIRDEMQRRATAAKVEADALAARMRIQESELATLRGELVSGNFDQVRLDALETDAEAAQSVYESFLQRYHEVARQGTLASVGARLLSFARPNYIPTSPHLLLNGALSIAAGIVLGLLAGLLAEQFRSTVESTEEVEQRIGARALVAVPDLRRQDLRHIPKANRDPAGYLLTKRMSPFAEAFRVLQTAIFLSTDPPVKVVALTSAMPGEGKTTMSLGLARVAAMGGQNVIVVDCDIRMRALNKLLGIEPQEGLQQVLSGERHWREVVGCDQASGAHVLPASGLTSKDIFGSGAMEQLIAELAEEYDLVILDCAPVFAVADTRLVASMADAVVVGARARKTPARALAAAISQLEIAGARVLGVALNRVDTRSNRRSFYDGLYYSKAFAGYYTRDA